MAYKSLKSDLTTELVDESFHNVTKLPNCRGRAGAVHERTNGHLPVDVGNDAEAGNSKRIAAGDSKGRKRKRTVMRQIGFKP